MAQGDAAATSGAGVPMMCAFVFITAAGGRWTAQSQETADERASFISLDHLHFQFTFDYGNRCQKEDGE